MRHSARAILFDLDDTLFSHRRFRLSGFAAVALAIEPECGIGARTLFSRMVAASREPETYGDEFGAVIAAYSLDVAKDHLITRFRSHQPNLRLHESVRRTLLSLRNEWRLAIVTNGIPEVQQRKVQALGLTDIVDTVVYATAYGSGQGKPDRAPFIEALARLSVAAGQAVFVGDDANTDIYGAARCGLGTIQTTQWRRAPQRALAAVPDAVVTHIVDVPRAAATLLSGKLTSHAA